MKKKWKSYCGWCKEIISEGDTEEQVRWALFEHYLLQHPNWQPLFHIDKEAWEEHE